MRGQIHLHSYTDKSEPSFTVFFLAKMRRGFRDDDLKRGPDLGFKQVSGQCCTVAATEHGVDLKAGLVVLSKSDVANQRGDLNLFSHWNGLVGLGFPIEVGELRSA